MRLSSPEWKELWQRIESFALDDPTVRLTFTGRLARENGWTLGYAVRVVDEYKRFMFLAVAAGHAVTPSEEVDQVWHLHLVYTHSYWEDFCGGVLGRGVHHGPTRGGPSEQERFHEQYERTIASYTKTFGQPPPNDIWPASQQRFGDDLIWRRVNLRRNWVIPKPRLPRWWRPKVNGPPPNAPQRGTGTSMAIGLAVLPLVMGVVNPLDFTGPQFLAFFALCVVVAVAVAIVLRKGLLAREAGGEVASSDLEPLQLALLTDHGRTRFAQAGLAALASEGTAVVGEDSMKLLGLSLGKTPTYQVTTHPPAKASGTIHRLHRRLTALGSAKLADAVKESLAVAREEEEELQRRELLTNGWLFSPALWLPVAPLMAVLGLGIAKIVVGLGRDKPVGFLAFGCFALIAITLLGFCRKPRRTKAGDHLLNEALQRHQNLSGGPPTNEGESPRPESVALAVGLFGTAFLVGSPLDLLHSSWPKGANGGGCGGGGCGGGGCGGCGGCGG